MPSIDTPALVLHEGEKFILFLIFSRHCGTHHVTVYRGSSDSAPRVERLCEYHSRKEFKFKGEAAVLVEFV